MAKRPSIDDQVQAIHALREAPETPRAERALREALASKHSVLVAAAAQVIAHAELPGLDAELSGAFERLMHEPDKRDKGCLAKTAIADALYRLESDQRELFLRGVRHVQREPVWGGHEDTAASLRGTCALALVRSHYPDAMLELARLLADAEATARATAAEAIAYSADEAAGAPLLCHKILAGDEDLRVTAAALSALLSLSKERAVAFVAELVDDAAEERREAAVLALGESRLPEALPPLRAVLEQPLFGSLGQVACLAIAMLRSDAAWDYLIDTIESASEPRARGAVEALSNYRHDPSLRERVEAAVQSRGDPQFAAFTAERFA